MSRTHFDGAALLLSLVAAATPVQALAGARALQPEESAPAARPGQRGGIGIDPGGVLCGIFGR